MAMIGSVERITAEIERASESVTGTAQAVENGQPSGMRGLLRNRNFRLLWLGEGISLLGDQFYLIALPWLVLQLTGDAFAMGTVLALEGIPRALFMLVGGALTDRFSPRRVMLISNLFRMALVGLLAGLVFTGGIQLWMIYVFALVFGLADAFFFPAQSAVVPNIVRQDGLQLANAVIQGTQQISLFAGPVLAGAMIALLDSGTGAAAVDAVANTRGIAVAFAFDALTFVVSVVMLTLMRLNHNASDEQPVDLRGVVSSIRSGLTHVWNDVPVRSFFLLIAASAFLINGPLAVGIPVLADQRLPEGAAAFGIIMSAYGGGSLLGTLFAAFLPRPRSRTMGIVLSIVWSGLGLGVAALGFIEATPAAALIALAMGVMNGYVVILFITWLQTRTPDVMMGRVMSLLMFASIGLLPVSNALTGALISLNITTLFAAAGLLMTGIVLLALMNPALRSMEEVQKAA